MIKPVAKIILFRGKDLKDGRHPIMLQLKLATRNYKRFSLGMSAFPKEWNDTDGRYRDNAKYRLDNRDLLEYQEKADDLIEQMFEEAREQKKQFDFRRFKNVFLGRDVETTDKPVELIGFLEWYVKHLEEKNKLGDMSGYKFMVGVLEDCGVSRTMKLKDVDKHFLEDLEKKLAKRKNKHTGELIKDTSIFSYFKRLRTLFNRAIYFDVTTNYPFKNSSNPKGYSFAHLKTPRISKSLSDEELSKFLSFDWEKAHRKMRLAWLVGYFIYAFRGMPISDASLATYDDISNNQLQFARIKTKSKVPNIPITKERQWILDIVKPMTDGKHLLPILFNGRHDSEMSKRNRINKIKTRVNTGLKMIAEEVGIEQNMHTYIFRHTFARKVLEKHGIWHLKETLGHKSVTTTQAYATSLSNKELEVVDDVY